MYGRKMYFKKIALLLAVIFVLMAISIGYQPKALAANGTSGTKLRIISEVTELGPENVVGQTFKVAVVIENVTNLYGLDVQLNWTTKYITCVDHTFTVPVEDYPDPIPPSPYAGILHSPHMSIKDVVDESANISGSEPGAMGWWAASSIAPAEPFNGSGTVVMLTFQVINQPIGADANITIRFIRTSSTPTFSDKNGIPIPIESIEDAVIVLHGRAQPAGPKVKVDSYEYTGTAPHIFSVDITIINLDPYWDLSGFDIQVQFDPDAIQAINATLGDFALNYNFTFELKNEVNNTAGYVWLAYIQLPPRETPSGNGTLVTIFFNGTSSSLLNLNASLAAFPHPERSEDPWNNLDSSVPIPHEDISGKVNLNIQRSFLITIDGQEFIVTTLSNSTVSNMNFYSAGILLFDVSGKGFVGYCNVTIPKALMWNGSKEDWLVLLDGSPIDFQMTHDSENTYIYFTYDCSVHSVAISALHAVPEFNLVMLSAAFALALVLIILLKNR